MTQDEFVILHGQEAWDRLVKPRQVIVCGCACCWSKRLHANIIVHEDIIGPLLALLGVTTNSLLVAKEKLRLVATETQA